MLSSFGRIAYNAEGVYEDMDVFVYEHVHKHDTPGRRR